MTIWTSQHERILEQGHERPIMMRGVMWNQWPKDAEKILKAEWKKGTATAEIARLITEAGRITTKNAVIGRAHRLGLRPHVNRDNIIGRHRKKPAVPVSPVPAVPTPRLPRFEDDPRAVRAEPKLHSGRLA